MWEFLALLLTALVFLLVGLAISLPQLATALAPILWTVLAILIGRGIVVYVLPGRHVSNHQRPVSPGRAGGMAARDVLGGTARSCHSRHCLSLPADFPQRTLLQEITFAVVLFTLLVQGTTTELVMRWTGTSASEMASGR